MNRPETTNSLPFTPEQRSQYRRELRHNFFSFYGQSAFRHDLQKSVFSIEADKDSQIILPSGTDLMSEVERFRKRIIHPLRMRGTSSEFMEEARKTKSLSAKLVDNDFEEDFGQIATHRILTTDHRLSNDHFLHILQVTATSAAKYAMTHSEWWYFPIGYYAYHQTPDQTVAIKKAFTATDSPLPMAEAMEIVTCYELPFTSESSHHRDPNRLSFLTKVVNKRLRDHGKYTNAQELANYTTRYTRNGIDLWDNIFYPFREVGFQPDKAVDEYSPLYLRYGKDKIIDILDKMADSSTEEGKLVSKMKLITRRTNIDLESDLLYLVGEEVTLDVIESMRLRAQDNEPHLKFLESR